MSRALFLRIIVGSTFGFVLLASIAAAESAWTVKSTNMRAGPDREYPVVTRLPGGAEVDVAGCVEGVTWCDVIAGRDRGWVYAGNLEFPYEGRRVVILGHSAWWHAPIVPFAAGPYWDSYYVGRPWYGRRSYWVGHPWVARPYVGRPYVGRPYVGHVGPRGVVRPGRGVVVAPRPVHVAPRPVAVAPRPVRVAPRPVAPRAAPHRGPHR